MYRGIIIPGFPQRAASVGSGCGAGFRPGRRHTHTHSVSETKVETPILQKASQKPILLRRFQEPYAPNNKKKQFSNTLQSRHCNPKKIPSEPRTGFGDAFGFLSSSTRQQQDSGERSKDHWPRLASDNVISVQRITHHGPRTDAPLLDRQSVSLSEISAFWKEAPLNLRGSAFIQEKYCSDTSQNRGLLKRLVFSFWVVSQPLFLGLSKRHTQMRSKKTESLHTKMISLSRPCVKIARVLSAGCLRNPWPADGHLRGSRGGFDALV